MTAHDLAASIATDLVSSGSFTAVFLDSVGTDESLLAYPYAVVAPSSLSHTPGGDEIGIEVGIAVRADGTGDTSKAAADTTGGYYAFGDGATLDALIATVRARLSCWSVGAIPTGHDSTEYSFNAYPAQSALLTFNFRVLSAFEDQPEPVEPTHTEREEQVAPPVVEEDLPQPIPNH